MTSRVLVTGATGFIGGHLVERLLREGHTVRAVVLEGDPGRDFLEGLDVEIVPGDVRDTARMLSCTRGVERVFHAAALVTDWAPRRLFLDVNVTGTKNLLEAACAARVERFVLISTNDVFGVVEGPVIDERFPRKTWGEPYPDTKIAAEALAWSFHRERGLPVSMVYPCWVHGPRDRTFVPVLARALLDGTMIYWRRGALVWPAYVENVVDLLVRIANDERAVGHGYLVHDGCSITLEQLCRRLAERLGVQAADRRIPYGLAYVTARLMQLGSRLLRRSTRPLLTTYAVKNLGSRLRFSIERAKRELGWTPPVPFEDGFRDTLRWLEQQQPAGHPTPARSHGVAP